MRIEESGEGLEKVKIIVNGFREKVFFITTEIDKFTNNDNDLTATEITRLTEEIRKKTEALNSDVTRTFEIRSRALREYNALAYNKGNN